MSAQSEPAALAERPRHRLLGLRLSGMMFLHWAMFGLWVPLLGRFLLAPAAQGGLGFTQTQLGLIFGVAGTLGALLAPFVGGQIADRYLSTQKLLALLLVMGGTIQWITAYQTTFAAWLGLMIASGIVFAPTGALSNSLAFAHMTDPRRQFPLVRLWGTVGWIVPAWVFPMVWLQTGLHFRWKPPFLVGTEVPNVTGRLIDSFHAAAILAAIYAVYCLLVLPHTPPRRGAREPLAFRKAFGLLRYRSFAVLVGVSLLISAIHNLYFIQTGPLLSSLGLRDSDIMPAMSIGQIFEIVMMAVVGYLLKRLGFRWVLAIGVSAYVLRFATFGTTSLPLGVIVASQALHGVCFACFYAAAFIYVDRLAEDDVRHSAQTVFGILLGVGPVVGGWLNGVLARKFTPAGGALNYTGYWYAAAAIGLVAMVLLVSLFRDEARRAPAAEA